MRNLLGEFIVTPATIAEELISSCQNKFQLEVKSNTAQGFVLYTGAGILKDNKNGFHGISGFYSIHKDDVCLYVGKSDSSIGRRLSRFVKEVRGKSRFDENHPAGKKYRTMWGDDLSGLTVHVYPCNPQDHISHTEVENNMIRILNPILNRRKRT